MGTINLFSQRRREVMLAAAKRWQAAPPTVSSTTVTPSQQARFDSRRASLANASLLQSEGRLPIFVERKIGPTLDWFTNPPSEAARSAGRPVARIVASVDPNVEPQGFATGFLISPSLLITNWHVFPDTASARSAGANFLYEQGDAGITRGITFELDPDAFFFSDADLDFAVVAVKAKAVTGELLSSLHFLAINGSTGKILPGMPIMMIQYPDGGPKRYATTNNRLIEIRDDGFLRYETDTAGGSSGSPDFSDAWEVCAVHHASIPLSRGNDILNKDGSVWTPGDPEDNINWIANEGVRISFIVKALGTIQPGSPTGRRLLDELLASTVDPADDIAKMTAEGVHVVQHGAATSGPYQPSLANWGMPVNVAMNFSGPVTIFVGSSQPAAQATAGKATQRPVEDEKSLRFDPNYGAREGYNLDFLGNGIAVPLPTVATARDDEMYKENGSVRILKYHHYSLAMNAKRRTQMWSAVNVDYDKAKRMVGGRQFFGSDRWVSDPRIPASMQLSDADVYGPAGQIDRGHVVRREDNAWGDTPTEVEYANSDTFHWTNCTAQHAAFNRSKPGKQWDDVVGLWGGFENHVQKNLQKQDTRACILAGPVLAENDPGKDFATGVVQYPLEFWKVVAVAEPENDGGRVLRTYGFLLSQADVIARFGVEFAAGEYARYQVPLPEITQKTGVVFDEILLRADTKAAG